MTFSQNQLIAMATSLDKSEQESLALASMARDDLSCIAAAVLQAAAMRNKVGSEFET